MVVYIKGYVKFDFPEKFSVGYYTIFKHLYHHSTIKPIMPCTLCYKRGHNKRTCVHHIQSALDFFKVLKRKEELRKEFHLPGRPIPLAMCVYNSKNVLRSIASYARGFKGVKISELEGHTKRVSGIAQLPNNRIASCSHDNTVKIWDLYTNKCIQTIENVGNHLSYIIALKDNLLAICPMIDKSIRIWDLESNVCLHTLNHTTIGCVHGMFTKGNTLTSWSSKEIKLWDLTTFNCTKTFPIRHDEINKIVDIGNNRVASISADDWKPDEFGTDVITIRDCNTFRPILSIKGRDGFSNMDIISLPKNRLASSSYNFELCNSRGEIKIWNTNTYQCIQTFIGGYGGLLSCLFNNWLVSNENTTIYNLDTYKKERRLPCDAQILCVYELDDNRIVLGGDGNIQIWH